jgi:ribosomal protein L32
MNSSLKKAYELLHFPLFLCVLVSCQLIVGHADSSIQERIASLAIAPLEQDVLWVLYRLASLASVESFVIASIVILVFTIASINRRQFIVNQVAYLFFLYFFTAYFFTRIASGMMSDVSMLIGISIIVACVVVSAFSGVPALIVRKMKARAMKKREGSSMVAASFTECKTCGATFLSNPQYCAKCLNKLA